MGDWGATREIVAKSDRAQDPHELIDELRQHRLDDRERVRGVIKRLTALEAEVRDIPRLSETGVLRVVNTDELKRRVKLEGRVFWLIVTGLSGSVGTALFWLFKHIAWK